MGTADGHLVILIALAGIIFGVFYETRYPLATWRRQFEICILVLFTFFGMLVLNTAIDIVISGEELAWQHLVWAPFLWLEFTLVSSATIAIIHWWQRRSE